jgi:ABC-type polysaccharide/polyol phosphate transport system ATPase subunit
MSEVAIKVENLSKVYKLYRDPMDRLKESLHPLRKKYHKDFYALKDVGFSVKRGEVVGIIGENGAGKSTLLKILTGVLTPSSGDCFVSGKVSSLLELGVGFNMELTGLENIFFNSTVLGYSRAEIEGKLDDIIDFADIGDFVNQPVKSYSSGMIVRLAFSVAINVDPDVLIIDEALSVGDIRFQQKCFRKLKDFKENGKTIVLVSHDLGSIINYCDRAVWFRDGMVFETGRPEDVCKSYLGYMAYGLDTKPGRSDVETDIDTDSGAEIIFNDVSPCSSFGDGGAEIVGATVCLREDRKSVQVLEGGEEMSFYLKIRIDKDMNSPIVGFIAKDSGGSNVFGVNNHLIGENLSGFRGGDIVTVRFDFKFPALKNDHYSFSPAIADGTQMNHEQCHWVHDACVVQVANASEMARMGWYFLLKDAVIRVVE